jgi:hypothetical protein
VARLLLEHGLLDELRLWVHPLFLGAGRPSDLLFGAAPAVGFDLTDTTTLSHKPPIARLHELNNLTGSYNQGIGSHSEPAGAAGPGIDRSSLTKKLRLTGY